MPAAGRKGFAEEAMRAAIDWSFTRLPLGRIVSLTHPGVAPFSPTVMAARLCNPRLKLTVFFVPRKDELAGRL